MTSYVLAAVLGVVAGVLSGLFGVGGGILAHGLPPLQHAIEPYGKLAELGADMLVGLVAGAVLVAAVALARRVLGR